MSDANALPPVIDGLEMRGAMNTEAEVILAHIRHGIRQGHPQVWRQPERGERVVIVGGGPSLAETERDLVDLVHAGAKLVTVNGSYRWCLARNLKPAAHIVLDARPSSADFIGPETPDCRYYLASQCHAQVWAAVRTFEHVGIFHAVGDGDDAIKAVLDGYYAGMWHGVAGGTTVTTRAIGLLRLLGYLRFDLFGVDSCWLGDAHHAYAQPQNARDVRCRVLAKPSAADGLGREFTCSPWHLKQLEDVLHFIRHLGEHFTLSFHGDGLIAYAIRTTADLEVVHQGE